MNMLVTGGTGFIGSHLIDLLVANGHAVRLFSRSPVIPGRWKGKQVSLFKGDLNRPETVVEAMQGMDVVFHVGEVKNYTRAATVRNLLLVKRMVEEVPRSGIKRLVFVSSITVAGIPSIVPGSEDTPPAAVLTDQYTQYKQKAEEIIRIGTRGADFSVLRPGIVYGPGSRALGSMAGTVRKFGSIGLPFVGHGKNLMPLIHVKDLANALYAAGMQPGARGRILNITDGQKRTWFDFFTAIAAVSGKTFRVIPLPPALLSVPAVLGDMFSGVFGFRLDLRSYIMYITRDVHFGNDAARAALGWEPRYLDLAEGVRDMIAGASK